jgi:thiamine-monophosphate kinase
VQRECILAGGDDYELLFTAAPARASAVRDAAAAADVAVARIGRIVEAASGLQLHDGSGRALAPSFAGFDHFRA